MEQEYKISINITPKAFEGLARQGMLCHQGICELCDDALAAALPGEKARVCVALAPDADKNFLQLAVADWGSGMELFALTNALQLGSSPLSNNRLNEHGYGLNNALACLSGGTGDWCIYTRDAPGPYFYVHGPFDLEMTVKTTDTIDLPESLNLQWSEPSSARSLPYDFLHTACVTGAIPGQLGILADGGLRISELAGLLFSCLHAIDTSQGTLYYIEINGQLTPSGKRTEITKTAASYRIVPLSPELGEELNRQRQQLEEQLGDLAFRLMCGQASCDEYIDTPAQAAAWQKKVGEQIPELLRSTSLIDAMVSERAYVFNLDVQNKYLFSMITCHALRRNYCTWLYCYSGLCTSEIYRLMGHSDKARPKSSSEGLTDTDLRRICLQNYVSHTLYHTPGSLTYSLSNTIRATEVPACNINLILPPKATINLILEDTEPSNRIHYSSDGILVEEVRREKTRNPQYDYSLLASDEVWAIKDKHKLLD